MTLVHAARMAGQMVLPEGEEEIFPCAIARKNEPPRRRDAKAQRRKEQVKRNPFLTCSCVFATLRLGGFWVLPKLQMRKGN